MADLRHYLSIRVGQQWYGVDVNHIVEALHMLALAEVPAAEKNILGLMTLRDQVVPVIDLRQYFGIAEPAYHLTTPIVAVHLCSRREQQTMAGLVVDEVDNVETVSADVLAAYDGPPIAQVSGVVRTGERLLLLLDLDAVSQTLYANPAAAAAQQ